MLKPIAILAIAALLFGCTLPWDNPPTTPTPVPTATPEPTPTDVQDRCPQSCDDGNPCTADICGPVTDFECEHAELFGPQPNCSGESSACMEWGCVNKACAEVEVSPCCGNGICEAGENCETCPIDCPCSAGELCCEGKCIMPECTDDEQCRFGVSDPCVAPRCIGAGTCDVACVNVPKGCMDGDGCCPEGCDYLTDKDCPAYGKGNMIKASNNVTVKLENLARRICYLGPGREQQWYAARIVVSNVYPEGTQFISPLDFKLVDPEIGRTLTPAIPGGDCYLADGPLLLSTSTELSYQMGEISKVLYFYPEGRPVLSGSKRFIFTAQEGERYIWLMTPQ